MKAACNNRKDISPNIPRSLLIIPPPQSDEDLIGTMEVTMRSLVLDARHPIALELAGTGNRVPSKPGFIIRATTQAALDHVEALLRAEYPQIGIQPLREEDDPFRLDPDEAVSAVELIPEEDEAVYSSERSSKEQRDPLLGLLTVLGQLPDHMRAIVQIGLVPVSGVMTTRKLSNSKLLGNAGKLGNTGRLGNTGKLGVLAALAIFSSRRDVAVVAMINAIMLIALSLLFGPWLPGWLGMDLLEFVLWGQFPALTGAQIGQLIWCAIEFVIVEGLFLYGTVKVIKRFFLPRSKRGVPDQVPGIDITSAYRTRILFYVIGPQSPDEVKTSSIAFLPRLPSSSEKNREEVLLRIMATFRQFHSISGIAFVSKQISSRTAHLLLRQWYQGLHQSDHLVSFRVLATLWHLPQNRRLSRPDVPQARKTLILPLSADIVNQSTGPKPIGHSEHGGNQLPFSLTSQFFSHHTLIAGKSGEGKNAFMRHLGHSAMARGGLVLIDPHGDLCEDVLKIVPLDRVEDVVLIDLSDTTASVGLNPLDVTLGRGRDKTISDLLKMLAHIWVSSWGAKMDNVFEMSLRTLFEANKILVAQDQHNGPKQQYTLLDVSPLLTNATFCHSVLQLVQDDYLHRWWREYYEPLSFAQQRDVINPLITKVAKFESTSARRILGQSASTLNLAQMIAERKIILLKLAKGVVGGDIASLFGATVLGLIQLSLEGEIWGSRIHLPIIIDEFEMLLGTDYGTLAELHKYGATFFLTTQSLEYVQKLNPLLLSTVQANVKQLIAFHVSAQDAEMLHKELGVERDDLIHLDMYSCYVAILAADRRQPTFSLKIVTPPPADAILADSIRTRCRIRYTYPVDEVDEMLRDAMLRTIRQAPLSKGKENVSAEVPPLPLASFNTPPLSGGQFLSNPSDKKTRFIINDTQPLPFTRELDTGALEILSREELSKGLPKNKSSQDIHRSLSPNGTIKNLEVPNSD